MEPGSIPAEAGRPNGTTGQEPSKMNTAMLLAFVLRILAVVLTLIAAVVMGAAKESVSATIIDPTTLGVITFSSAAKSSYSSAFMYFVAANSIVCAYSVMSSAVAVANKANSRSLKVPTAIADVIMLAFLFSGNGAAIAIQVLGAEGNSHAGWIKYCNVVPNFCGNVTASIVLSMVASAAYLLTVILGILDIHEN